MNIQIDTASLTKTEAQALAAFLSVFWSFANPVPAGQTQQPTAQSTAPPSQPVTVVTDNPTLAPVVETASAEPASTGKRTRRTKAEMAADRPPTVGDELAAQEAARKAAADAARTAQDAAAPNGAPKSISADELRSLLNVYIARHSMEEAIGQLKTFGCNRVSEALGLEAAKLGQLAAALNG